MSIRLGVLISGKGSTLSNLIDKINTKELDAEISLVVASRPCEGLKLLKDKSIIICRKDYSSVADFSTAIFEKMREAQVDLVTLSGFLSLLEIPEDYNYRVMNIHPSLIPSFCGKGYYGNVVHKAVIDRGVKFSGCTVHFVDNEYDHGEIIVQKVVPVYQSDNVEDLASRVFASECIAYPEAINLFASGKLK